MKKSPWFNRWLRRSAVVLFVTLLILAGAFWLWPLHFQAYCGYLGEALTERPSPEEYAAAPLGGAESEDQRRLTDSELEAIKVKITGYFPDRVFTPNPEQEPFWEIWTARDLLWVQEPSIFANRVNPATHTYRLHWARSFDPEITVRLDVKPDGSALLTARHVLVHPSRGRNLTTRTIELSRSQTARLIGQFDSSGFWQAPATVDRSGLDGSTWLFEGCRDGRYHTVMRWTPENGDPLKSLGLTLLETAGFWRGPVY